MNVLTLGVVLAGALPACGAAKEQCSSCAARTEKFDYSEVFSQQRDDTIQYTGTAR